MKPYWADNMIYELFDEYIERCVLNNDSFLTNEKKVITINTIDDCIDRFINKGIEGNDSFESKIARQFKDATYGSIMTFAHVNWLWCMAPSDFGYEYKKNVARQILGDSIQEELRENIYPKGGFGDAGPSIKFRKYHELSFLLLLMKQLKLLVQKGELKSLEDAKTAVENICVEAKYARDVQTSQFIDESVWTLISESKLAMYNILTHLANPGKYEPISSDGHKYRIHQAFRTFIKDAPDRIHNANRDEQIYYIRQKITEITGNESFTYYDDEFRKIWNYSLSEEDVSEVQGLQYKKAIILYGPPGTSKTYTANKLAEALITEAYLNNSNNVIKYFKKQEDYFTGRIHRLQLHSNYTYEDFIAGIQLDNNATKVVKGKLFQICEVSAADELPHVLILDEINRIDLSRLLGEAFSALENRDEPIDLSLGNLKLTIPSNLYVIGTMNEIDFSLEQVDFALRRRFLWFLYGFNKDVLSKIIWGKDKEQSTRLHEKEVGRFVDNAEALNKFITKLPELGDQYQVGHTFFAEVVDIYRSYKELKGFSNRLANQLFRSDGPVHILWAISIEPILNAFLGNLDEATKSEKLAELKSILLR